MTAAQCRSRRGGFVDRKDMTAASSTALSSLSQLNPGWVEITSNDTKTPFQYAVDTELRIQDQSVTMVQGLISQGQQHTMSHIGLAESSTLLHSLKSDDLIRARSWGLDAGSQSFTAPRNGSLVLGGYDASSFEGGWFSYDIPKSNLVRERSCPLQVQITEIQLTAQIGRNKPSVEWPVAGGLPLIACIEPYDNQFRFPTPILNTVKRMLGKDNDLIDASTYPDLYNVEPGLVYDASSNISFSMTVTIEDGLKVEIPSYELVRPLRGLDAKGAPMVYLFVNHENSTFSLARQNQGQTFLDVKSSGKCPSAPALTKSDKGLIAVGVVLGVLIIGLVCYVAYRCWKKPLANVRDAETKRNERPDCFNDLEVPSPQRPSVEEG
ncbi:hypothetical protein FSARC_14145 [Fusarium sarcochroum]|uniref:Peptidase A1 domain-containing protein n=1 Tax=Fusarium sarcochroum TaxID=1208366 RepID=A0A8H4SVR9_9HYPO|nr:hypothetical protein FSARC_14145 [Fusarium sarcochroum]